MASTAADPGARERVLREDIEAILDRALDWQRLSGRTVMVTGAGGFLGGYLVRSLLALNRSGRLAQPLRVLAVVRDAARGAARLADVAARPELQFIEWDLGALGGPGPSQRKVMTGVDWVMHAASQASPRFYGTDPVGTMLPNTVGTAWLLDLLRQRPSADGGMLFVSSSEVYGAVTRNEPLREVDYGSVDPATLRACYAEGKRMGETMCLGWHHQHGVPAFIVRPFHTYGPGLLPGDGRVFADFAYNVRRGEPIVMNSDGLARRAFCYASDAVAGFFTVMLHGQPGTAYNVANPDAELSVMALAEMLVGLFPERGLRVERRHVPTADYVPSPYQRLVPDVGRLAALGWQARVTPQAGFRRMIEALE